MSVDFEIAHARAMYNRRDVERSERCGCFCCLATFAPSEIHEWCDEDASGQGQTPLCPRCGIDAVLASASGFPLTPAFLSEMERIYFDLRPTTVPAEGTVPPSA